MAHNLEIINGVASFVENGKKEIAWHGLGKQFDRPLFVAEAIKECRADYNVSLQPIVALTPELVEAMSNEKMINAGDLFNYLIAGKRATMRTDQNKALGIVGDSYGIVQNIDAFKFVDLICTGKLADRDHTPVIETAGVLGHGERVFVSAKFPQDIILDNKGDDRVEMYVMFTTSHDGTGAVNCIVTPVRVVCNNTLRYAMQHNFGKLSFKHTVNVMSRLDLVDKENASFAYRALNMYDIYKKSLEDSFNHLKEVRISDKILQNIVAETILPEEAWKVYVNNNFNIEHDDISTRGKNLFNNVLNCIENGVGQEIGERGTGLWAINGITSYFQNEANFKDDEIKMDSIINGNVAKKVQKAYDLISIAA